MLPGKEEKAIRRYPRKKLVIGAVTVVLLTGLIIGFIAVQQAGKNDMVIQGTVKMEETSLNSKIAGVIEEILVEEGDTVEEGDIIIKLESDTMEAKLRQAEGAKSAAEAQADKAAEGARNQEVAQAKAAYDYAQKTYDRMKILLDEEAISQSIFDEAEAKYIAAKATYDMLAEGARDEDKAAADALVAQAEGAIDEVNSYLNDSVIKAPLSGIVSAINVSEKELISTGMPLAAVTDTENAWVEVNVKETDLGRVELGGEVTLTFPAYEDMSFTGTITKVNQKPDFAVKRATNESGSFDIKSYGVKIKLPDMEVTLYAGMTVFVDFGSNRGK